MRMRVEKKSVEFKERRRDKEGWKEGYKRVDLYEGENRAMWMEEVEERREY